MLITNYIDKFKSKNILIIGDVMIDSYLWGDVKRISPEAPVPILSRSKREFRLGGAANVARNLKYLGANPILCTVIGDDSMAFEFKKLIKEKNKITDAYLIQDNTRPTTTKTRIISNGQQLLRLDDEVVDPISKPTYDLLLTAILKAIKEQNIDAIILEDYDKGVIDSDLIEAVTQKAQELNIPVFVDPKKKNFYAYNNVTLFKPNFNEFCSGLNVEIEKGDIDAIIKQANIYRKEHHIDYLLITLSEHGMLLCGDSPLHIPAQKRDITDVSGAGDTVISVISLCYAAGMPIDMAAKAANIAGGLVCTKPGVVPVVMEELLQECNRIYHI